jgi:hypothetical protein
MAGADASPGWIFDAFEGQVYNRTRADMLPELLHIGAGDALVKMWGREKLLGIFVIGWLVVQFAGR